MNLDANTRINMAAMKAAVQARKPVVLVGPPGTGKTEMVRSMADDMGYELINIIGSRMDATDVGGLPKAVEVMKDDEGNPIEGTTYLAPDWQVKTLRKKKIVLFFDEFSNTPASVRASLLIFLQNREFPNGVKVPQETIIILAMNPSEQAADGYELDLPTTNRLVFINWNPTVVSWLEGMSHAWGKEVSAEEMAWKRKIVAFIKENPTWLHVEPNSENVASELLGVDVNSASAMEVARSAWPSRRSWDNLSAILAFAGDDINVQDTITQGTVGYGAAADFREWLRKNGNIDPQKVIDTPEEIDWATMLVDDANVIMRAINAMIDENTVEKVINVYRVIAEAERTDIGSAYLTEFIKKVGTLNKGDSEKQRRHKQLLREIAPLYREVGHAKR